MLETTTSGLLGIDVDEILATSSGLGRDTFEVVLSSPTGDIEINEFLQNIIWKRDYAGSTTDELRVILQLSASLYRKYIYTFKDQLEITIIRLIYGREIRSIHRYKFFILSDSMDTIKDTLKYLTDEQLDAHTVAHIEGQCVDRDQYALNDVMIQGIYQDATVLDVMHAEFIDGLKKANYEEGAISLKLDITPPDNETKYGHIIIPSGTKLLSLPTFLQNSDSYGIYNCAIGTYIQEYKGEKYLWVYPLYDVKQFHQKEKVAMIFLSANKRAGMKGNTVRLDGPVLKILPSNNPEDVAILDEGNARLNLQGDSIAYANPDNVYRSYQKIQEQDLAGEHKTSVTTQTARTMPDGSSRTQWLGVVSNVYKYRSNTVKNMMSIYQLRWYNGDIDLLYPGMPVVLVQDSGLYGITKQYGQIQSAAQHYYNDSKETHIVLNIAVMSEEVFTNQPEYDTNILSFDKLE